jgi:hypothetical protein
VPADLKDEIQKVRADLVTGEVSVSGVLGTD